MKIITIFNRKGGIGKTATAHNLGLGLYQRGYKVLFIDLDAQMNLSTSLNARQSLLNVMDVLLDKCNVNDAIISTDKYDVLPSAEQLATADLQLTEMGKEYRLKEAIEQLNRTYDYIVIDTPPTLNILTINALTASNEVVIPCQTDAYSLDGLGKLSQTIKTVQKYTNPNLKVNGVLVTRHKRSIINEQMLENLYELTKVLGYEVYNTLIRECIAVKEAQALNKSVLEYAPKSNASIDYNSFINEFIEREAKI